MSLPALLNPQTPTLSSLSLTTIHIHKLSSPQTLKFPKKLHSFSPSFQSSHSLQNGDVLEDHVIGDCIVFEDGVFEDPYLENDTFDFNHSDENKQEKPKGKKVLPEIEAQNLVPDKWREVQAEINITKKEKRKIAKEIEFNSRVERRKKGYLPLRQVNLEEYKTYKEAKLAQLNPLVLDNPSSFPVKEEEEKDNGERNVAPSERVAPKNPRWAVYGRGLEDVSQFFNSGNYEPGDKKPGGARKLFTKEEKFLLNRRIPDLATATSYPILKGERYHPATKVVVSFKKLWQGKWQPLHTLAASGEFYLVDALLKHNVDINTVDKDGLTALHRAIICKKQAITNYLLRESANPFVRDEYGATLMHYAVQTASSPTIKLLLLYNVDINLQDNDGWTPLHLAVQAQRTDVVRLLLIKGANKSLKNQDGLTPLDLCLYFGRDTRTYELIKLLKQPPKQRLTT